MAGDDGEIRELRELAGPVLRVFVVWTTHASHDETQIVFWSNAKRCGGKPTSRLLRGQCLSLDAIARPTAASVAVRFSVGA